MAINDVSGGGCIMYEIFFGNFWVIILCPVPNLFSCVFAKYYLSWFTVAKVISDKRKGVLFLRRSVEDRAVLKARKTLQ